RQLRTSLFKIETEFVQAFVHYFSTKGTDEEYEGAIRQDRHLKGGQRFLGTSSPSTCCCCSSTSATHDKVKEHTAAAVARHPHDPGTAQGRHPEGGLFCAARTNTSLFLGSKSDFSCQYRVQDLDASPICLDYWYNPDNANESVLCWGDIKGRINALFFLSAAINLFERQSSPTEDKQETTLIVKLKDIKRGKFKIQNKFISHEAHTTGQDKPPQEPNNHVCLWNPYVMSNLAGFLTGHVAPVIQVLFNLTRSQVYSFSKDKVLRIWDVQLQVCMQRLAGISRKDPKMKAEVKDRVLSHDRSVTSVIFSWQLNQLLTACQGSNLSFWLIDTGQRLRQTPNAHGDAEITTLANDPAESRFYSGGTDGIV
uniref:WD_REPEATS_REGION domain-containing protein n=1 Tax=Macrostomum lignano TaxID=282301 RepID=A0A1I8F2F3_9PLAT